MNPPQPQSYRYFKDADGTRWKINPETDQLWMMCEPEWRLDSMLLASDILLSPSIEDPEFIETDEHGTPLAPVAQQDEDCPNRKPISSRCGPHGLCCECPYPEQTVPPESRPMTADEAKAEGRAFVDLFSEPGAREWECMTNGKDLVDWPHSKPHKDKSWVPIRVREVTGGGWRDISSAPKDGTRFLAWRNWAHKVPGGSLGVTFICRWRDDAECFVDEHGGSWVEPTKWQPLPQPPAQAGA